MSEGDLLKIKLQMLQFQMDVSAAKLARVQALASLRQLLGYESVPENYEVVGDLEYKPVNARRGRSESPGAAAAPGRARGATGRHGGAEPVVPGAGQRQARRERQRQLLARRRREYRFALRQHRAADFRSQSGRNCAHALRHHAVAGTLQRAGFAGAHRRGEFLRSAAHQRSKSCSCISPAI